MWILHPQSDPRNCSHETPTIWIRESQRKIILETFTPAQLVFEVVRVAHASYPVRISSDIIVNLAENGVDHKVLCDLAVSGLEDDISKFQIDDGAFWAEILQYVYLLIPW